MNPQTSKSANTLTSFIDRHLGPRSEEIVSMLKTVGFQSLDALTEKAIPKAIASNRGLDLPAPLSEEEVLKKAKAYAEQNILFKNFIGLGYYGTLTPGVVQRNILENPAWYTAYTPYQAEIAQGRLEALLNFQTMIMELTGFQMANASLLDEGTAAAEAMALAHSLQKGTKKQTLFVDKNCLPQTIEVLGTRAEPLGIEVLIGDAMNFDFSTPVFAAILQYPGKNGQVSDFTDFIKKAKDQAIFTVMACDLMALTMLKTPAEMGADMAIGTTQRFGVPMGFGGPHAAYMATKDEYKRLIPGRIIGVSIDRYNRPALRLALQTREQHIRREKATSNICTAQVLLAVMASMYAVYHGPQGLKAIAHSIHQKAQAFRKRMESLGYPLVSTVFFDTVTVEVPQAAFLQIRERAQHLKLNFWYDKNHITLAFDETHTLDDVKEAAQAFNLKNEKWGETNTQADLDLPKTLVRQSEFLQQQVFNQYHSETEMLRYITRLQNKDLSLVHSMIPLGSCTMKLNATTEMTPITWPEFANLHPFAPAEQTKGSVAMIHELEHFLAEITGFKGVSLQPNAGSQGEYAGLLVIRKYHRERGDGHRNICLIPSSAHGTNPASAVMAGMKVVVVRCDDDGNIDVGDLKAKAEQHKDHLAALMVTYPSTHGVFEETIREISNIIHSHGGQVYMDGANMNALVGLCRPGDFGPDVCHLNLHKTFCIPHGGGGPGVGPIGVAAHLKNYLPKHSLAPHAGPKDGLSAVSAAPWGSALILAIPWAYIAMTGYEGLKKSTQVAILNANYIAKKLAPHYQTLYKGIGDLVAHECILDTRPFKNVGVNVDDIAKRLIDYGFHAPTMSWPVIGTLMIEPTESESKAELDRFIEAMIQIRSEITKVEQGTWPQDMNPLTQAPHTTEDVISDWNRPYTRADAIFPLHWIKDRKFFASVNRVDNAYGDKNLVCSCDPLEDYMEQSEKTISV